MAKARNRIEQSLQTARTVDALELTGEGDRSEKNRERLAVAISAYRRVGKTLDLLFAGTPRSAEGKSDAERLALVQQLYSTPEELSQALYELAGSYIRSTQGDTAADEAKLLEYMEEIDAFTATIAPWYGDVDPDDPEQAWSRLEASLSAQLETPIAPIVSAWRDRVVETIASRAAEETQSKHDEIARALYGFLEACRTKRYELHPNQQRLIDETRELLLRRKSLGTVEVAIPEGKLEESVAEYIDANRLGQFLSYLSDAKRGHAIEDMVRRNQQEVAGGKVQWSVGELADYLYVNFCVTDTDHQLYPERAARTQALLATLPEQFKRFFSREGKGRPELSVYYGSGWVWADTGRGISSKGGLGRLYLNVDPHAASTVFEATIRGLLKQRLDARTKIINFKKADHLNRFDKMVLYFAPGDEAAVLEIAERLVEKSPDAFIDGRVPRLASAIADRTGKRLPGIGFGEEPELVGGSSFNTVRASLLAHAYLDARKAGVDVREVTPAFEEHFRAVCAEYGIDAEQPAFNAVRGGQQPRFPLIRERVIAPPVISESTWQRMEVAAREPIILKKSPAVRSPESPRHVRKATQVPDHWRRPMESAQNFLLALTPEPPRGQRLQSRRELIRNFLLSSTSESILFETDEDAQRIADQRKRLKSAIQATAGRPGVEVVEQGMHDVVRSVAVVGHGVQPARGDVGRFYINASPEMQAEWFSRLVGRAAKEHLDVVVGALQAQGVRDELRFDQITLDVSSRGAGKVLTLLSDVYRGLWDRENAHVREGAPLFSAPVGDGLGEFRGVGFAQFGRDGRAPEEILAAALEQASALVPHRSKEQLASGLRSIFQLTGRDPEHPAFLEERKGVLLDRRSFASLRQRSEAKPVE